MLCMGKALDKLDSIIQDVVVVRQGSLTAQVQFLADTADILTMLELSAILKQARNYVDWATIIAIYLHYASNLLAFIT